MFVTGTPGASAGGLALILHPEIRERLPSDIAEWLLGCHRQPEPRVDLGQRLAANGGVTAMIDVSDGVAGDLGHILTASGVGATLEETALPIAPELRALAEEGGPAALDLFLGGGEDYELLFTCASEQATCGVEATRIGTIDAEPGLRLRRKGGVLAVLDPRGHDHFDGRSR